ncbi:MAG: cytochrome c3 family protein [Desulfitobacteriaceae bacterium]
MSSKQTFKQNKLKKFLPIFLFILVVLVTLFWGTFEKTSDNAYCSSCHMMKPEFYTWKASSHSKVDCVTCHVQPGVMKKVRYKLFSVKEWYAALTGQYGIAIQSSNPIPDATCNQCHNMKTRQVSPSGDLIIPHTKHEQLGVGCTKCHTGIAHGNIAEKRVTFQTDYGKWDESVGQRFMSDVKSLRPNMDVCMNCHKVRKAPVNCSTCHKTAMTPSSHKEEAFKNGEHGKAAAKDLKYCDSCHSYMSKEPVVVSIENESKYKQFLSKDNGKALTMSVSDYAKANTFCKDCHGKRPPSHNENFSQNHGVLADQNKNRCFTCHENRVLGNSPVTKVTCGTCHPSIHYQHNWRPGHPIELPVKPQVTKLCYTCHTQVCAKCHGIQSKSK